MKTAQFYENITQETENGGYYPDKIRFITSQLKNCGEILDIGCNNGYIGSLLIKMGNKVHGVDIAKHKILEARKKGIKAVVCDIENSKLPYEKNFFDAVILGDVIEHIFDTDRLLEEIYRVMKPNSKLIITTPNVASLLRRVMLLIGVNPVLEYSARYIEFFPAPVGHIRYYTSANLRNQLIRCGFSNTAIFGDRVNFYLFSSRILAKFIPSIAVNLFCITKKCQL